MEVILPDLNIILQVRNSRGLVAHSKEKRAVAPLKIFYSGTIIIKLRV